MPLDWQSLFFSAPPKQKKGVSVFTEEELDELARREQAKLPEWKQRVAGLGESAYDFTAGLLGLPGQPQTRANQYGELTEAGIPFLALGKKLRLPEINKKPVVWRGDPGVNPTGKVYEEINPQYFNRRDTLGYMGHAAENKDYAINSYAYKRGSPYPPGQTEYHSYDPEARPNLTAVTAPSSTNAVDLTKLPDAEDTEKLIKGLEWWKPHRSPFGSADRLNTTQKARDLAEEIPLLYRNQLEIDKKLREGAPLTAREMRDLEHIGNRMDDIRIPLNDPEITDRLGFDAIRYTDIRQPSWAFPDVSKMETPWGVKLGKRSMGEYPYRVQSARDYSTFMANREDIGFFKTDKEAMKAAAKQGTGARVFLGSDPYETPKVTIPGEIDVDVKRNKIPGLTEYLNKDKAIQKIDVPRASIIKDVEDKQKYAKHMYNKDYLTLNTWQQEDVDNVVKNNQYGNLGYLEDTNYWVDDLDDVEAGKLSEEFNNPAEKPKWPEKNINPVLKEKIKSQIAKEDYADLYENLSKEGKTNVDDIYETLINNPVDDVEWLKKQYPSLAKELDEVYGVGSVSNPDFDKLTPNQLKILEDFEKKNKIDMGSSGITKQKIADWEKKAIEKVAAKESAYKYLINSDVVEPKDIEYFKKKGGTEQDMAAYFYGKLFGDLDEAEKIAIQKFYDYIHPAISFPNKKK